MDFTKINQRSAEASALRMNEGLRSYMLQIYAYMALAMAITGFTAFFAAGSESFISTIYNIEGGRAVSISGAGYILMFAPLVFVLIFSASINRLSYQAAQLAFWAYSVLMGLSMCSIFLVYTGESIARMFFITASVFGAMSIYGYSTKKDLSGFGTFLMMGVIGIIVAAIVNIWLQSSGLQFAVSVIGVLVFTGLTAYDTQRLKSQYYQFAGMGSSELGKVALMGALSLYLDFINLFIQLLHLFGERK